MSGAVLNNTATLLLGSVPPGVWWGLGIIVVMAVLIVFGLIVSYFNLWLIALLSKARVNFTDLIGMKLRKVNPRTIVTSRIRAVKAGIDVSTSQAETHFLAGGNVPRVVDALIAADRARIALPWDTACAIDLAGYDILEAVQSSVNPKVIHCPNPSFGRDTINPIAQDGIEIKARARITVQGNLSGFIGGATEETIVARVGESIVTTIGSAPSHKHVLEELDRISEVILEKRLDAGTAFEILSIDIEAEVGQDIGARLQAEQEEADRRRRDARSDM